MKVSIIVPVYNVEKYLDRCLESLVNQTLRDIEILVVNDGTKDNSQKIIDKYAKMDSRVIPFKKKNGGLSDARNYALDKASGEYVGFVDSDDYVAKDMYEKLYNKAIEENADIVGWLEIEGTDINYPVLQGKDDEYYMTHNYKKEYSRNGSIFLSKDYNWDIPSNNLLIYGHNLNNGTMFQELLKYKDEEFYKEHPIIRFTTAFEDVKFEIISAFQSRVYYKSEKNVFRYYYFVNPETEEEYNEFVESAKRVSLYEIEATANYGDSLITLSTCSYHVKDGRFAVVGKKINKEANR